MHLLIAILAALLVNALLTPVIIRLARRRGWYDHRNHRKIHVEDTPRIGGIGILIGFLAAGIATLILTGRHDGVMPLALGTVTESGELLRFFLPPLLGMLVIHLLGLVDDFRNLRAVVKLLVQIIAAAIVTIGPFRIERLTIPFVWYHLELGVLAFPVTVIWIVAISNAFNFIDGVDGLAGGTAAICALFFGVISLLAGQLVGAMLAVGLFGSILGFLIYNAPPARIFMGDSGSYVLGFVLSLFPLILASGTGDSLDLLPALTIMAVPVLDMMTSIFRRLRRGKHPFSADREHMHHKLMDLGFSTWRILAVAYGGSVVMGLVAIAWYLVPVNYDVVIAIAAWLIVSVLMRMLSLASRRAGGPADS